MNLSLFYTIREGLDGMRRARLASTMAIVTIAVALVLLGVFTAGTLNLVRLLDALRSRFEFEVFVDNSLDESGIDRLGRSIRSIDGVATVTFVSREQASEIFRKEFGNDFLDVLENNPLPASFRIALKKEAQNAQAAERIARTVDEVAGVDEVVYRRELLSILDRYVGLAVAADFILGLVVCLSSFILVINVVRLTIVAKRRVIETMQLVGATNAFVRRPFLVQGLVQGALGGVGAALVLRLIERLLHRQFGEVIIFPDYLFLWLLAAGVILAMSASFFGVRRYLSTSFHK